MRRSVSRTNTEQPSDGRTDGHINCHEICNSLYASYSSSCSTSLSESSTSIWKLSVCSVKRDLLPKLNETDTAAAVKRIQLQPCKCNPSLFLGKFALPLKLHFFGPSYYMETDVAIKKQNNSNNPEWLIIIWLIWLRASLEWAVIKWQCDSTTIPNTQEYLCQFRALCNCIYPVSLSVMQIGVN